MKHLTLEGYGGYRSRYDDVGLYFRFQHEGVWQIWKRPASGEGEAIPATRGPDTRCWVSDGWLYFGRAADVWRTALDGTGEEERVLKGRLYPESGHWQVLGNLLYFIDFEEGRDSERWMLKRMDLSSRQIEEVVQLPQQPSVTNGLSVAPDETWFLYTVDNTTEQDLMIIEGFN